MSGVPIGATVAELGRTLRGHEVTAVAVTEAFLARARALDPQVGAFATRTEEAALEAARAADVALAAGTAGPLAGIPVAVKDLYAVRGVVRTNGSRACTGRAPETTDAGVVARLRAAGAVVVGTTRMHELALGPTGVNPAFGTPVNPWDATRMPGGSSSGSGVAVATGLAPIALGSDTGGSIRIPSAFCGVTGLKPTYGRVTRCGMTPLAWSLDHAGPIVRTAEDAAIVLGVLAGHDPADPASARRRVPDYVAALPTGARGVRVGLVRDAALDAVDAEIAAGVAEAAAVLGAAGATTCEVRIPSLGLARIALGATVLSEAAIALRAAVGDRVAHVGLDVRVLVELGGLVSGPAYVAAQRVRSRLYDEMRAGLTRADVLLLPTCPVLPPPLDAQIVDAGGGVVSVTEAIALLTGPFNLTGLPALALPCGASAGGLPLGAQLVGRPFDEGTLLAVGHGLQRETDWHQRRPPG